MPIYSYRCETCGHQQDVLQKMSDPLLVTCPACGAPTYRKQVTAAGFQLKGSGWYVTDFRNPAKTESSKATPKADGDGGSSGNSDGDGGSKSAESDTPAKAAPSPATESKADSKGESKGESGSTKASPPPASGTS